MKEDKSKAEQLEAKSKLNAEVAESISGGFLGSDCDNWEVANGFKTGYEILDAMADQGIIGHETYVQAYEWLCAHPGATVTDAIAAVRKMQGYS